jgi:hypothetical protein
VTVPEQAGIEIHADLTALRKELTDATNQFRQFNQDAVKAATGVKTLEDSAKKASFASQALASALGFLGAGSIQQVLYRLKSLGDESERLAIELEGAEARAKAVFGNAFPQISAEAEKMGQTLKRSSNNILQMRTDFALLLDSIGLTEKQTMDYSRSLTELTIAAGKAFPNLSDAEVFEKVQSAISGSARALKELGVSSSNKAFADFGKSIGVNVNKLNAEGTTLLRIQYILASTTKLQDAAAKSAGSLGDKAKENAAKWEDAMELIGKSYGPFLEETKAVLAEWVKSWVTAIQNVSATLQLLFTGRFSTAWNFMKQGVKDIVSPQSPQNTTPFGPPKPSDLAIDWSKYASGGGGDSAKKLADELKKSEDDYIQALADEAKTHLDNLKLRREELKIREKLGILTKDETSELNSINRRLEFKTEAIGDAVDAWQKEADTIKEVEDRIKDLNKSIADEKKSLEEKIKDINNDAKEDAISKVMDLVKKRDELLSSPREANGGLSGDASRELGDISDQISGFSADVVAEAERRAKLTPAQLIAEEKDARIKKAKEESDARVQELQAELDAENQKLQAVKDAEAQKKQAVIDSLNERLTITSANYDAELELTKAHVDAMIAEFNRLRGAKTGAPAFATGGPVHGPGGPRDDKIAAWLSNGEYVINAMATRMYRPLIERINSLTLPMPRFAAGGAVTTNSNQTIHVNQNNYGDAARHRSDARSIRWMLKKYP